MKIYTVSLVEVPAPLPREAPPPVTLEAAGMFDAVLKAGPQFEAALKLRRIRPIAMLRVTGFQLQHSPEDSPQDSPQLPR